MTHGVSLSFIIETVVFFTVLVAMFFVMRRSKKRHAAQRKELHHELVSIVDIAERRYRMRYKKSLPALTALNITSDLRKIL